MSVERKPVTWLEVPRRDREFFRRALRRGTAYWGTTDERLVSRLAANQLSRLERAARKGAR